MSKHQNVFTFASPSIHVIEAAVAIAPLAITIAVVALIATSTSTLLKLAVLGVVYFPVIALFKSNAAPAPSWLRANPYRALTKPHVSCPSIETSGHALPEEGGVIYGVHPHGPTFAPLQMLRARLPPNWRIFTADAVYALPLLNWFAFLHGQVVPASRKRIVHWLRQEGSCVLMPGGVVEDFLGTLNADDSRIVISTKHEGFLKLAMEERAAVVPSFAFGMDRQHTSWLSPRIEAALYRFFGQRVLLMMNKRFVPGRNTDEPLTVVTGVPLRATDYADSAAFKAAYFEGLDSVFEAHKHRFPDYAAKSLCFTDAVPKKFKWEGHLAAIFYVALSLFTLFWYGDFVMYKYRLLGPMAHYRNWPVYVHAASCFLMWTLSATQFLWSTPGTRAHKLCGYSYFVIVLLFAVPTAYYMSFQFHSTVFGGISYAANMGLSNEMAFHTLAGLFYVVSKKNRDVARHRKHLKWVMSGSFVILVPRTISAIGKYVFGYQGVYMYTLAQTPTLLLGTYNSWKYGHTRGMVSLPWWHALAMFPLYYVLRWSGLSPSEWAEQAAALAN
jgi:hypothetical protein